MERDDATLIAELLYEECIAPYLSDLGSLEAQLALEKKVREIIYAEREACARLVDTMAKTEDASILADVAKAIRNRGKKNESCEIHSL